MVSLDLRRRIFKCGDIQTICLTLDEKNWTFWLWNIFLCHHI